MKFLANENFPGPGIKLLRSFGIEVVSVSELYPGISDFEVIQKAKDDNLVILTFDKDYGEIIFRLEVIRPPAVIFFRNKGNNPTSAAESLKSLIDSKTISFENIFTVIDTDGIRQRQYI